MMKLCVQNESFWYHPVVAGVSVEACVFVSFILFYFILLVMDREFMDVICRVLNRNDLSGSIPSALGKLSLLDSLYRVFVFDLPVTEILRCSAS